MSNPSNLYAEKIYSEHPLVLWALDDQLDYIGLITEEQRNIGLLWNGTNGGSTPMETPADAPFPNSYTTLIYGDVPTEQSLEVSLWSPDLINFQDLNQELGTFCVGTYFYSNSIFLQTVSIGYEYTDPDTSEIVQNLKTFTSSLYQNWGFISETFEIPDVDAQLRMLIKIKIFEGSNGIEDNEFYFNGITFGQLNDA